jgi:hypothetical protein
MLDYVQNNDDDTDFKVDADEAAYFIAEKITKERYEQNLHAMFANIQGLMDVEEGNRINFRGMWEALNKLNDQRNMALSASE